MAFEKKKTLSTANRTGGRTATGGKMMRKIRKPIDASTSSAGQFGSAATANRTGGRTATGGKMMMQKIRKKIEK